MIGRLVCGALLVTMFGCVDAPVVADKDHEWVERTYRTGSNIPSKTSPQADGVQVMNKGR